MIKIFQEADLPKLSQTSIFAKFNQTSNIAASVKKELSSLSETIVKPAMIPEMIALMKLNGSPIVAYEKGDIVVSFNPTTSNIPSALPFIIINHRGTLKCFVFAQVVVTKLNNQTEYVNFMTTLEAAYLALMITRHPNKFISNRQLMQAMCHMYMTIVTAPLEQRLYMKGDNLVKAMMYAITYFYRIIDGDRITSENIPYKKLIEEKIDPGLTRQIVSEIKALPDMGFFNVLELIKQINPVRYKNLNNVYLNHFNTSCGITLLFAIENPAYIFLEVCAANYRSNVTQYNLNKVLSAQSRKMIKELASMSLS